MRLLRLARWFTQIGSDPDLAVSQAVSLKRQVPLLYGLLIINSLAVAVTHRFDAPFALTVSVPALLFAIAFIRMIHWFRSGRCGPPSPESAQKQLRMVTWVATPIAASYTIWALALAPYGGPFEQAHVGLYISTTVIGCIFCLVVLPQAALLVAASVLPAFIIFCLSKGSLTFATIGINVALVLAVLLRVLFNSFEHFSKLVQSRSLLTNQHCELQRLNDENRKLAMTDSLTGLPNRRQFYDDLDASIGPAQGASIDNVQSASTGPAQGASTDKAPGASAPAFAVGVLDLDRFKPINDTYGHQVGDRLLKSIGERLRATAGPSVKIYRLGGDEFGLIDTQVADFNQTCERLLQQVQAPLRIGEIVLSVGGSLGIAHFPEAGRRASDLFDRADYALYHAKHVQGGGVCVFTPNLETAVRADRAIEAALQASSFEDELSIMLQPIVELASGRLSAVEVLARWSNPMLGEISTMEFIAIAERSTAIHSITRAVFKKGLMAARQLPDHVAVSFNISACDLTSANTLAFIQSQIASAGIAPQRIWIEVTETAVMRNADAAAQALQAFRDLGVRIALDDFGTGYSSLGYVHRLPLDKIKIDRSFVRALESKCGGTITSAVITLCHTIGLTCVAEGVETESQRQILAAAGCEHAQGYLFSRPLALEDLLRHCSNTQTPKSWLATPPPNADNTAAA